MEVMQENDTLKTQLTTHSFLKVPGTLLFATLRVNLFSRQLKRGS